MPCKTIGIRLDDGGRQSCINASNCYNETNDTNSIGIGIDMGMGMGMGIGIGIPRFIRGDLRAWVVMRCDCCGRDADTFGVDHTVQLVVSEPCSMYRHTCCGQAACMTALRANLERYERPCPNLPMRVQRSGGDVDVNWVARAITTIGCEMHVISEVDYGRSRKIVPYSAAELLNPGIADALGELKTRVSVE